MFVAVEHEILDPELFQKKAGEKLRNPPPGMCMMTAMFDRHEAVCQCIWQVESLESVLDFIDAEFSECAVNSYFEVDPDIAIG
ncbi:hypothetical protein [Photobacterium kagoshimensis]|uniref:hypothetical protein n=1 Tax=Photobacterium kagoshimensis TaxID=2910242 RepID=UPI003D0AA6B8